MAELEKVVISAEGRGFEALQAKMAGLAATTSALSNKNRQLTGSMGMSNKQLKQNIRHTDDLTTRSKMLWMELDKTNKFSKLFLKSARMLMFAVIGLGIEFAVVAVSLMSVNAAFAIGNALAKAYRWSMGGVAAAAAAAGAALAIAAAAQREFTAAQSAHTQKATPLFGSAMDYSMAMLRNLTSDTELAVFGIQNLNAAFAAVSRNSQFTGKSQQVLRALRDFAAIGGDQGKNLAKIGEFVGLLQKEGKITYKVTEAAKAIGPEFEKAFKKIKKGGGSVKEVFDSILSGDMSKAAGITGAADLMSGTLFGMFKKFKTLLTSLFADIGTPLLGPAKNALQQIFSIIKNGIQRISPGITKFGEGSFLPTLVKATEKITDFTVKLFDKYLPKSQGMLTSIKNVMTEFRKASEFVVKSLDRLRAGGSIVIDMFGAPLKELFKSIGENVESFAQLAVENKDTFIEFGDRLAGVVDALMDFAAKFKEAFTAALPTINKVLSIVENIVRALGGLMGFVSKLPYGGEIITGVAGYGILKGRREAQRQGRRGVNMRAAGRGMMSPVQNFVSMMGLGMIPGGKMDYFDPRTGISQSGYQYAVDAANKRASRGVLSNLIFKGTRFPGAQKALGYMGGFLNPIGATRAAMAEWDFHNQNTYSNKLIPTQQGAPGAVWDKTFYNRKANAGYNMRGGAWVTEEGMVPNPNGPALTGVKGRLARAKAGLKSGFSVGGMLGGMALSTFANSSMAPSMLRENAGAIDMGAGLMAINPLIGMGAMGAGGLFNMVQGKGARTKSGGVLTGAASGAAVGAALTSFLGPGAGIGAVVGAMVGGVVGYFGGDKAERQIAKEAAKALSYGNLRNVTEALVKGNTFAALHQSKKFTQSATAFRGMSQGDRVKYIDEMQARGFLTDTQAERARRHTGTFGKELETLAQDTEIVTTRLTVQFDELMNGLQGASGKSKDELMKLAKTMNINLYDPTVKLTDAIAGLGLQMDLTAQGLAASGTDAILRANRVFDEMFKQEAIAGAFAAAGKGIKQAGGGSRNDYIDLMQKATEYGASTFTNDPLKQLYAFQTLFGAGGTAFQQGKQLSGLEANFRKNAGAEYTKLVTAQSANLAQSRSAGIMQLIAQGGYEFTDGAAGFKGLSGQLQSMYTSSDATVRQKAVDLENFLASGASLGSGPAQMAKTLASFGIDIGSLKTSQAGTLADQLSTQQQELQDAMIKAIATGFDDKPEWWDQAPVWWTMGPNDTSSPRAGRVGDTVSSRLGRTLSRHNYFNSMFTGKRQITSSWRQTGLGSPSSDHVTGNAYDLVGQNLGQYATTINKAGGFAEFHGSAGSRHLHVVPPSTPLGDTGTSRVGMAAPAAIPQQAQASSVVINVYPSEGQSEKAIAQMVMNEISKAQRNYRERK